MKRIHVSLRLAKRPRVHMLRGVEVQLTIDGNEFHPEAWAYFREPWGDDYEVGINCSDSSLPWERIDVNTLRGCIHQFYGRASLEEAAELPVKPVDLEFEQSERYASWRQIGAPLPWS